MLCFFQVLNSVLSLFRQVVETNLVAFDCHWILINEVSIEEIMCGSGFDFFLLCEIVLGTSAPDGLLLWGFGEERTAFKAFDFFSLATFSTSEPKSTFNVNNKDNSLGSYEYGRIW